MPPALFKALLLDLEDRCRAETLQAHKMIFEHSGLDRRRARRVEGIARYNMMEKGFAEVCQRHGGVTLLDGLIPHSKLKTFQPFMRFEVDGQGFIFGLAAISEPSALPSKNMSRKAGVTLNYSLSPRFDFDGSGPKTGDIFILLLVSRDHSIAGMIEELAIGVIDSNYEQYLFYESIQNYIAGYGDAPTSTHDGPPSSGVVTSGISLKTSVKTFVPRGTKNPVDNEEKEVK